MAQEKWVNNGHGIKHAVIFALIAVLSIMIIALIMNYLSIYSQSISPNNPCLNPTPLRGYSMLGDYQYVGYSDNYISAWNWYSCIYIATKKPPSGNFTWPFYVVVFVGIQPEPNYYVHSIGAAINSYYSYTHGNGLISWLSPEGIPQVTEPSIYLKRSITMYYGIKTGHAYANDTWLFITSGGYGIGYDVFASDMLELNIPNASNPYVSQFMVYENITLARIYRLRPYYVCIDYYYYALQILWTVYYNPATKSLSTYANTTLAPSGGPLSSWVVCRYTLLPA